MADHAPVSRDEQPEAVPAYLTFFSSNHGTEAENSANQYQYTDPPIAGDRMVDVQQDARKGNGMAPPVCAMNPVNWGTMKVIKIADENSAGEREECWVNQAPAPVRGLANPSPASNVSPGAAEFGVTHRWPRLQRRGSHTSGGKIGAISLRACEKLWPSSSAPMQRVCHLLDARVFQPFP